MSVFPVAERFKLSSSDSKTFRRSISQLLPDVYNLNERLGALIVRCSGRTFAFILRLENIPTSDLMIFFPAMRVSAAGFTFWPSAVAEERLLPTYDAKALRCPIFLTRAIKYIYGDGVLFFYCYFSWSIVAIELSFS